MSLGVHRSDLDQIRLQSHGARASKDSATSLRGLENIKELGREDQAAALKKVAKQFESMFISQLMKSMRQSNEAFSDDSFFNSSESRFHQDMYDQQLTLELSEGRGLGLSDQLYQQLLRQYNIEAPESESKQPGNASFELSSIQRVMHDNQRPTLAAGRKAFAVEVPVASEVAVTDKAQLDVSTPESFIQSLKPLAEKYAAQLNLPADVLISQAALETGWGKHVLSDAAGSSNNLFNIKVKSDWQGDSVSKDTIEYRDGVALKERAQFKRYDSVEQSFEDYVKLIKGSSRYQQALDHKGDANNYLQGIQQAGYATDPNYANKISSIVTRHFSS